MKGCFFIPEGSSPNAEQIRLFEEMMMSAVKYPISGVTLNMVMAKYNSSIPNDPITGKPSTNTDLGLPMILLTSRIITTDLIWCLSPVDLKVLASQYLPEDDNVEIIPNRQLREVVMIGQHKISKYCRKNPSIIDFANSLTDDTIRYFTPTIPRRSIYTKFLEEPWFSLMKLGLKTIEVRLFRDIYREMCVGDTIVWTNRDFGDRSIETIIVRVDDYASFDLLFMHENKSNCLPGFSSAKDWNDVYYKYYTKDDEYSYGVVAIELRLVKYN